MPETIDYSYLTKRLVVTCTRCEMRVGDIRSDIEAVRIATGHARYMAEACKLSGHACVVSAE